MSKDIQFKYFKSKDNYVSGIVGDEYRFGAKLFDEPSDYGINNGRVSKLMIVDLNENEMIMNYDRGWDIYPSEENKDVYDDVLNFLEKAPKTRF